MIKNLLLLTLSTLFALAMAWLIWSWIGPVDHATALLRYDQLVEFDPARTGGHLKPDINALAQGERRGEALRWITNSQGFRTSQPTATLPQPGVFRILFYGDSFVDGMRTAQADTIGAQLQQRLNVALADGDQPWQSAEVLISGHNNPANAWYHWQTHGHKLKPHLVILGLTIGNDITWHNLGGGVIPRLDNGQIRLTALEGAGMSDIGYMRLQLPASAFRQRGWAARTWRDIRLGLQRFLAGQIYAAAQHLPPLMGPMKPAPGKVPAAGPFVALGLFTVERQAEIERLWSDFSLTLEGLSRDVQTHGNAFLVVPFPVRIQVDPLDWRALVDAYDLDPLVFALDLPNKRLSALCREFGTWCPDPLPVMQAQAKGEGLYRALGDMHFNEAGQAVVAEFLFNQLRDFDLVSPEIPADSFERLSTKLQSWQQQRMSERFPWLQGHSNTIELTTTTDRDALRQVLVSGWHIQDHGAIWSRQKSAYMNLPNIWPGMATRIEVNLMPFVEKDRLPVQTVTISRDDQKLQIWSLDQQEFQWHCLVIEDRGDYLNHLKWNLPMATSPISVGVGSDKRELAVAVAAIRLTRVPPGSSCD